MYLVYMLPLGKKKEEEEDRGGFPTHMMLRYRK